MTLSTGEWKTIKVSGEQSTVFRLINAHTAYLILKFQGVALSGGRPLKEGDVYFKVIGIIHKKFQKFVVFFPNNIKWVSLCYIILNIPDVTLHFLPPSTIYTL